MNCRSCVPFDRHTQSIITLRLWRGIGKAIAASSLTRETCVTIEDYFSDDGKAVVASCSP